MYKGFNLDINFDNNELNKFYDLGSQQFLENQNIANSTLKELIFTTSKINGSRMQDDWFPQVDTDIFISHSGNDQQTAIILAGFLKSAFGLKTFIDSCIWGYSNDLLRLIDNRFCRQTNGNYDYNKRNQSTSHVHMMLSTALNMMIDKTECLFFLNTPNSVTTSGVISSTESPWIYSEITMSKLIRKKKLQQYRREGTRMFSKGGLAGPVMESIEYELDLNHLTEIDRNDLINWNNEYQKNKLKYPLDILYRLNRPKDFT